MSTRAQIRFATREEGVSFNEHPEKIHAQFYKHSDGYPEGLGLDIADCIMNSVGITNWEIESLTHKHGDLEYIYYIWQYPGKETWISIFEVNSFGYNYCETCGQDVKTEDKCIFVGLPTDLLKKYNTNTNDQG
jgi:hypothetical protein